MAKLVLLLRVKDGIFFVDEWIKCFEKLADEIVVLDNGSTDGTDVILEAHPKVVNFMRTTGYNEGRDKKMLYEAARKRNPDWCLWLDVDEIFEAELTRTDFDRLMSRSYVNKYAFRRFHFIDREYFAGSWFRLNYSSGHDRVMWREQSSGYFENKILDSPNVKGITGLRINTNFRLKHLGYISKELVDKKAEIYRAIPGEREAVLQEMYLQNEKKIKWSDKRNSNQVVLLNGLLNTLQFISLFPRGMKKAIKIVQARLPKEASTNNASLNKI
ncbi:MAG: glycosyltransferase family 2 protein [Chitinophagaceae bacterium]